MLLLQMTNAKWYMVYQIVAVPKTSSDLQGHACNAGLLECDFSSSCSAVDKITADSVSCGLSVIADAVVDSWCCLFIVQLNGAACSDDDTAGMNRRLTFYRLCDRLASKLQSLFVPLVGQIIKDVCRVLKQTTEGSAIVHSQPWYCTSWLHIVSQ